MSETKITAPYMEQLISKQKEKTEVAVMTTEENKLFLMVGNERIPISAYNTKSIGGSLAEIHITILGEAVFTELSTISK